MVPNAAPSRPAHSTVSPRALWTGRALSGLAAVFLLFDATVKVLQLPIAVEGTTQLGYPQSAVLTIGLLQVACWILYAIPRTAVLGAILWTGYLGGAVATHVRVGSPLLGFTFFPVYVAAFLWAGLWLREPRLHDLLPTRTPAR